MMWLWWDEWLAAYERSWDTVRVDYGRGVEERWAPPLRDDDPGPWSRRDGAVAQARWPS